MCRDVDVFTPIIMIAHIISISRVFACFLALFVFCSPVVITVLVVYALLSDFFDGWYARTFSHPTAIGALFDHGADKICSLSLLAVALYQHFIPLWLGGFFLFKEIMLTGSAVYLMNKKTSKTLYNLRPSWLGKISFAAMMFLLCGLFLGYVWGYDGKILQNNGYYRIIIYSIYILNIVSLYHYMRCGVRMFFKN